MTSQTTLDRFYKIVSAKTANAKIKSNSKKTSRKGKIHVKSENSPFTKRKQAMSEFVQSEVEILEVKTPNRNNQSEQKFNSPLYENVPRETMTDANLISTNSPVSKDAEHPIKTTDNQTPNKSSQKRSRPLDLENISKKSKPDITLSPLKNTPSPTKTTISPTKIVDYQTPLRVSNQYNNNFSEKKNSFSPKRSPSKKRSPTTTKPLSPRKLFFADRVNTDTVQQAVENLNLVRQGSINQNEFDLESIYRDKEFSFVYSDILTPVSQKFEIRDLRFPREKHADHLFMTVMDVFSEPLNCGYFSKEEINKIFSLFTLSPEAQMLFVRLLKRKIGWHRINNIKYPEITSDLNPPFRELIQNEFCTGDLDSEDISALLSMLQADEIKSLCQKLKIDHKGNKPLLTSRLLKYGSSSKSFFTGAKTPKTILRSKILSIIQPSACLTEETFNLFNRVLTLLHPVQDPSESIADLFLTLTSVHKGEILYPNIPKKEPFPIFQNRLKLIEYVKSKNTLREVLLSIEKKEWHQVRELGHLALKHLKEAQARHVENSLPLHIKKFVPEYAWIKVLSKSIDAFKKDPEHIPDAVNILKTLINDEHFIQSSRGRWYGELALIEMHHKKDLESSAALTLDALEQDTLTEVDVSGLVERLKKLMRRKNGISQETKVKIQKTLENITNKGLTPLPAVTKTITANMANRAEAGGKSTWSITTNGSDKSYGSVETLAMKYYTSEENFCQGLHCEGALPISLFTIFFWEELYNIFIPGVFVSSYQEAPLDLFTAEFFNNRKKAIEDKINFVRALDLESFSDWMQEKYTTYVNYKTIMPSTLFKSDEQFKEVVTCLGINGVTGICERLVSNYRLWRSGFPDLIVWNITIPKCKIIEVKGPGDSLSEKQKLWLQYLERLGIAVEVCHVEALSRSSK